MSCDRFFIISTSSKVIESQIALFEISLTNEKFLSHSSLARETGIQQ
jgi:hypothetical protein